MSDAWVTIIVLAAVGLAIKSVGPVLMAGRTLPPRVTAVIALLASSLLAALVLTETVAGPDGDITVDARLPGVAVAAGLLAAKRPLIVAVLAAAVTTALVRAV
jgi:branched-subunit amino acid transport protein